MSEVIAICLCPILIFKPRMLNTTNVKLCKKNCLSSMNGMILSYFKNNRTKIPTEVNGNNFPAFLGGEETFETDKTFHSHPWKCFNFINQSEKATFCTLVFIFIRNQVNIHTTKDFTYIHKTQTTLQNINSLSNFTSS